MEKLNFSMVSPDFSMTKNVARPIFHLANGSIRALNQVMKIALNLKDLDEAETMEFAATIGTSLPDLPAITPNPPLPALAALSTALQGKLNGVAAAKQTLATAVTQKDDALAALRAGITQEAGTVQDYIDTLPPNVQEANIETAGFKAAATPTRLTSLPAITGLSLTAGDDPGEMEWHCDPVARKNSYIVEYTTDPVSPTAKWIMILPSTKSSGTITGLASGTAVSVRVHAAGTHGVVGAAAIAGPKIVP